MRWAIGPAVGGKINRTMYLTPEELKSHMYAHIVEEITEGDEQIVLQAIEKIKMTLQTPWKGQYGY